MVTRNPGILAARQHGMAIITVLVMLVAISLFGVAVMNMGGLEQRMSGNTHCIYHKRSCPYPAHITAKLY